FVSSTGDSLRIIKLLTDHNWQDETLRPSWALGDTNEQPELVTSFSPSGRQLLAIDLNGNAFDIHKEDTTGRMKPVLEGCPAFVALAQNENLRAVRWAQDESRIYLGNQQGHIHQLTPEAGCAGQDLLPEITMPNSYAILDIQEDKNQQLLVSQPGLITRIDSKTWSILASTPTSCQLPMGALSLDATHLLIACLVPMQTLDPDQVPLALLLQDKVQYIVQELPQGEERIFTFQDSSIAGLAIDVEAKRLYVMSSSSLGMLENHDLLTGAREISTGLLIDGILDP
ncbi:MAG: hypothetical protein M3Q07_06795, partial [Pseudobdellovibrionaceae bacterium]|nr:hypothetical protein [Pseudobdellovibrionaceae bacterium]